MIDFFRQFFAALESRVRSNFAGYVVLAFLLINWKPILILILSHENIFVRISHFEGFTTYNSLVWYPILFGVLAAIFSPWLNLVGAYIVRVPVRLLSEINEDEVSRRKIRLIVRETNESFARAAAEKAEADKEAASEERIIGAAKRSSEIREIQDETVRRNVEREINDLRSAPRADFDMSEVVSSLDRDEKYLLNFVASRPEGTIRFDESENKYRLFQGTYISQLPSRHEFITTLRAANNLKEKGLMDYDAYEEKFSLTAEGYDVIEKQEAIPF